MLLWILAGWSALSLAGAALFCWLRRRARPSGPLAELAGFLDHLGEEIQHQHPDAMLKGVAPERDCLVLAIRGQETLVPLQPVWRLYRTYPFALSQLVARLLEQLESEVLEQPEHHRFLEVFDALMPQVRSTDWLRTNGGSFGDGGLVHRKLTEDLVACYVVDDESTMVFVTRAHLKQWCKSPEDIHQIALQNLKRRTIAAGERKSGESFVVQQGDGFDAARVLLLDQEAVLGAVVALPDRDHLWVGTTESDQLPQLMALAREQNAASGHPVSAHLYRVTEQGLERLAED